MRNVKRLKYTTHWRLYNWQLGKQRQYLPSCIYHVVDQPKILNRASMSGNQLFSLKLILSFLFFSACLHQEVLCILEAPKECGKSTTNILLGRKLFQLPLFNFKDNVKMLNTFPSQCKNFTVIAISCLCTEPFCSKIVLSYLFSHFCIVTILHVK